jgi:hypothetical protein
MSKKLENVEYLIKIEQKNKKQLEEKYTKQIHRIESQIEKFEKELESTLKELNEKEARIFEIQRSKLDVFKQEISKYQNVYNEIDEKHSYVQSQIDNAKIDEEQLYNHSGMFYEDYLSYTNEIEFLKKKVVELKENLSEIEKTYPKEFEFLLQDIELEKEMNEISAGKKQLQEEVEVMERNKKELLKLKDNKSFEMQNLIDDIKKIEASIETGKKDNHLVKLEEYIVNNISDMLVFEKMKILIQNYYNQKNFDLENELNVLLIKNLNEKMKEMKNEFVSIKNEKMLNKGKLEKTIEELSRVGLNNKNVIDRSRVEKDINLRQVELERLNNEINILELNCKKKETLFNKYIIVLRSKCRKSSQESYFEMNPALIIETEFEEKFKEEMLKLIDSDTTISIEEKVKNKNLVEIYFKELINREKILQASINKKRKNEETIENLAKEIEKIEENYQQCEGEINSKKAHIGEIVTKEKIFNERIETRNRNLTSNLEQLGEMEFEKYLKSNDQVLKNMKKVYGNKILDKVFKVQKQKFLETVIMDHSYKKGKVNEYIQMITRHEATLDSYSTILTELESNYKQTLRKYDGLQDFKESKFQEKIVLEESKVDLKEKMEVILEAQIKEIESEKKQLQFKFNLNFYITKVQDLGEKISELNYNKETLLKEYENYNNIINEKEHKLYIEDLDLKNNLISLSRGVNEENSPYTVMPYKVNKSYESARKLDYNSSEEDEEKLVKENLNNNNENFNDLMKKSVAEYRDIQESVREENLEESVKREEESKSKNI